MELFKLSNYVYPTAIIAAYVVVTLSKNFPNIQPKYYPIIAVLTGVLIVLTDSYVKNQFAIDSLVAGALSGLVAVGSYEVIKQFYTIK